MIRSLPCDERRARTAYPAGNQHRARVFGLRSSSTSRARRIVAGRTALYGLARFVVPRERDRVTGSGRHRVFRERRAASPVGNGKRVWVCLAILRITHYACPEKPAQSQMQTPLTPSLHFSAGSAHGGAARASPRTDVPTRVRSQRTATGGLAAPRRRPTGPTRPTPRRANMQQGYKTETGERRECEKLSRRGGRVGSPGGVWACTRTTRD